jgi:hypothetical protein
VTQAAECIPKPVSPRNVQAAASACSGVATTVPCHSILAAMDFHHRLAVLCSTQVMPTHAPLKRTPQEPLLMGVLRFYVNDIPKTIPGYLDIGVYVDITDVWLAPLQDRPAPSLSQQSLCSTLAHTRAFAHAAITPAPSSSHAVQASTASVSTTLSRGVLHQHHQPPASDQAATLAGALTLSSSDN